MQFNIMVRYHKKRGGSGYKKIKTSKGGIYKSVHPNRKTRAMRNYNQSKKSTTKKCTLTGKPRRTGTGHWLSYGKGVHSNKRVGFLKKLEKVISPQHYIYNKTYQLTSGAGTQTAGIVGYAYDGYDVTNYNFVSGASKVILKSYNYTVRITNQCNAPMFIDLYDIIARRDMNTQSSGSATANCNPSFTWSATEQPYYYGSTPFESQEFCSLWKVLRVTRLNLSLGETAEHVVKGTPQRVWNHAIESGIDDTGTLPNQIALSQCLRKLSTYTMAVVSGCPTDANNATIGSANGVIDFITVTKYTYENVGTTAYDATYRSTNIAAASGDIMDTGTGTGVTVANI
nr:MAG: capsid protein [Cressdnaviricota sp.]